MDRLGSDSPVTVLSIRLVRLCIGRLHGLDVFRFLQPKSKGWQTASVSHVHYSLVTPISSSRYYYEEVYGF